MTWLLNLLKQLFSPHYEPIQAPILPPDASNPPSPMQVPLPEPKKDLLTMFCLAIQEREGYFINSQYPKGTPAYINHNPGNIRCGAFATACGATGCSKSNFAVFPTYDIGLRALKTLVTNAATGKSSVYRASMTIPQFFALYSPSSDGNDPISYAHQVAQKLGVDSATWQIKSLIV